MLAGWPLRGFALLSVICAGTLAGRAAQPPRVPVPREEAVILTPDPGPSPRINGPKVYGCRPGNPFLYRIPATGQRPMKFAAANLPEGLTLDSETGIITGAVPRRGQYTVTLEATNSHGSARRRLKICCGDLLALTPPMGWNHWYAHYHRITDQLVREAADVMVASGMADVGYQYVSIDDCWMNAAPDARRKPDPLRVGPFRDAQGNILPNKHFPDMKALTDYIHSKGLKAGIYTSPGLASGNVRRITTAEQLRGFHAGGVLVCDAIQPMMTHLVPLAAAVVERRGGMLIHGAIIAREMGIPCVNGVAGAVELLQDGDFVTVDGHLGIVTVGLPEFELELA